MRKSWNPRFIAYAKAHGHTPVEQLKADRQEYPGGCMCGFILWLNRQWGAFRELHGFKSQEALILGLKDAHRQFDEWLARVIA